MANNIDERIVELQFDNKQFEDGVQETIKSLDQLKKGLKLEDVTDGFAELDRAVDKVDLNPIQNGVERLSEKFSALEIIAISALNRITNQAMAAGENLIKSFTITPVTSGWDKYEQKVASVQKIMNSQVGLTIDMVEASLDKIEWFTNETSYQFDAMISTLGSFAAAGIPLQQAEKTIVGLANAAAISGVNAKDASHAFLGFQRAIGSGYLSLGIWNSYLKTAGFQSQKFVEGCIKAAAELGILKEGLDGVYKTAKGTTVSLETFGETLNEKWLNKDVINKMAENFSVASDQLYEIMNPDVGDSPYETVTAAIKDLRGELDEYSLAAFEAGQETKTWGDTVEYVRGSVAQTWSKTWELIFGNYEEATKFFSTIVEEMYELFVAAGERRNEFLAEWKELGGRNSFINGLINSFRIVRAVLDDIKAAILKVIPPVAVESAVKFTQAFEQATVAVARALGIEDIADTLSESIDTVADGLEDVNEAGEAVGGTLKTIAEMANLVIRGDYGNGAARREALEALGYSYEKVQNKVNELLGCSFRYTVAEEDEAAAANMLAKATDNVAKSIFDQQEIVISVTSVFDNLSSTFNGVVAIAEVLAYTIGSVVRVGARILKYVFKLGEGVLGITGSIGDLLVSIKDFIINNDIVYQSLSKLADLIGLVLTPVINIFTGIMDSLSSRSNPIVGFITSIADAIELVAQIDFAEYFENAFAIASTAIQGFGQSIREGIARVVEFISQSHIFQSVISGISTAFMMVAGAVTTFWNILRSSPTTIFDNIKNFYQQTLGWIKNVQFPKLNLDFEKYVNTIKEFGKNTVINPVINAFKFLSDRIKEFGSGLMDGVSKIISFVKQNKILETALQGLLLAILAIPMGIMQIWDAVKGAPIAIFNTVKDFFISLKDRLMALQLPGFKVQFNELWESMKEAAKNFLPNLSTALKNVTTTLSDYIVGAVQGTVSIAKFVKESNLLGKAMQFIQPIIDKIMESLKGVWTSMQNMVPKVISSLKAAFDVFKGWFSKFKLGQLKWQFDDFWRSFLPKENILVKLNDFKRDGISGLFHGIGVFKNVGREMKAYYESFTWIIRDYMKGNKFVEFIVHAFRNIRTVMGRVFDYVAKIALPIIEKVKQAAKPVTDKIVEFAQKLQGIDANQIMKLITVIGALIIVFNLMKAVMGITNFLSGIGDIASALSTLTTAVKIKAVGAFVVDLAIAVGIIGGIFYLISKLDWDQIARGCTAMLFCGGVLVASLFALGFVAKSDVKAITAGVLGVLGIAAAIGLVALSLGYLKDIGWDEYRDGMLKVGGILLLLGTTAWILSKVMKNNTLDLASMGGLFIFVMTLSKLISLLDEVSQMDLGTMLKSLGILLGVTIMLTTIAGSVSGLKFSNTFSLVGMTAGLWLFIQLVKGMAKEDYAKITVGLLKMVPLFIAVGTLSKMAGAAGNGLGGLGLAATILSLGITLKLIVSTVREFGRMPTGELVRGGAAAVVAIIAITTAMKVLMSSANNLSFFKYAGGGYAGTILAFSAAIFVAAEAIKILANIENPLKAVVAAGALSLVIVSLGAALRMASTYTGGSALQIGLMIAAIIAITAAIAILQALDVDKALKAASSLALVIGAVGLALMGITAVPWYQIMAQGLVMVGVIVAIAIELKSLADLAPERLLAAAHSMAEVIAVVGIICGGLAAFHVSATAMAAAGAGIGAAFAAIEGIIVGANGLIALVFGGGDLEKGLDRMVLVFQKLGEMFGGLAGGVTSGYVDKLDGVGEKLTEFANGAKGFFETMGDRSWGKMVSNMSDFVKCIKVLNSEKPDPETISAYSTAMFNLGTGVKNLMSSLTTAKFDFTKFNEFSTALPPLIDILKNPINVNDTYWETFSGTLVKLGEGIVAFSDSVKGDQIDLAGITNASSAVTKLVTVAEKLKDLGSFDGFDKIIGETDENGDSGLVRLAKGLKGFYDTMSESFKDENFDIYKLQDMFEAVRRLAVAASKLPQSKDQTSIDGKIFGIDFGFQSAADFTWDTLTDGLVDLAKAMVDFSTTALGISDDGLTKGLDAVSRFASMAQTLPTSFKSDLKKFLWEDDTTIGGFGEAISDLAEAIKTFHDQLKDLDETALTPAFKMIDKIANLPKQFERAGLTSTEEGGLSLAALGADIIDFANNFAQAFQVLNEAAMSMNLDDTEASNSVFGGIASLFNGFFNLFTEDNIAKIETIGQTIAEHLAIGLNIDNTYISEAVNLFVLNLSNAFGADTNIEYMKQSGIDMVKHFSNGIKDQKSKGDAEAAADYIVRIVYNKIHSSEMYSLLKTAGEYLVDGLVAGLKSKEQAVRDAAAALGRAANDAFQSTEQINSPSKVWAKFGSGLVEGLTKGMYTGEHDTVVAAEFLARRLNESFDSTAIAPTITPVVDLGDAVVSASRINTMFDANRASALSASMEINSQITQMNDLVDMTSQILGTIQNGSDLYLDDNILAGRINRRLGIL